MSSPTSYLSQLKFPTSPTTASLPNLSPEIPDVPRLMSAAISSVDQSFLSPPRSRRTCRPSSSPTISRGRHTATFPSGNPSKDIQKPLDIYQADQSLSTGRPSMLTFSSSSTGNLDQRLGTIEEANANSTGDGWQVASETSQVINFALPSGDENYQKLIDSRIFQYIGLNGDGDKVYMFSACRLPPRKQANYEQLLHYCLRALDSDPNSKYCLVYLHKGLGCWNMPSHEWIWRAYDTLDRSYRKNMTKLYVVHPTNLVLVLWSMCLPFLSFKFWQKVEYVRCLHELQSKLKCSDIYRHVPTEILEYDRSLKEFLPQRMVKWLNRRPLEPTRQFGATLSHIARNNNGDVIPPILRQCVEYLDEPMALATRGLFVFNIAELGVMRELKNRANRRETPDFSQSGTFHVPANLMKHFFFDLQEPLFPYELYDQIQSFNSAAIKTREEQLSMARAIVLHQLPLVNYEVLKYLLEFLIRVLDDGVVSGLTASELALAFAPTLAWRRTGDSSTDVFEDNRNIQFFLTFLIRYFRHVFVR